MRRVRMLVTCTVTAACVTSLGLAALEGCGAFDGSSPDPITADGAAPIEGAAADSGALETSTPDAMVPPTSLKPIYARGYGSIGDAGAAVTVVPTGLLVDPSGGVIVAGSYAGGPVDVGAHSLPAPAGGDAFLVQLDGSGGHVTSSVFGDAALQTGGAVAGSVTKLYATFGVGGTIAFNGAQKFVSQGTGTNANAVAARFDAQLAFNAYYGLSSPSMLRAPHLAVGTSETAVLFGEWNSSLAPGGGSSVTRGSLRPGLVVARLLGNNASDVVHTEYCPDGSSCTSGAVATNVAGEALLGGKFTGDLPAIDGGTALTATDDDAYLIKLDAFLVRQWMISFGGSGSQEVTAIAAVPKTSDFVVAGVFHGSFAVDGRPPVQATDLGSDIFLARVDRTGKVLWAKTYGGGGDDVARALTVDPDGNVFLVGDFHGPSLSFGGAVLVNADNQGRGTRDVFLAWLDGNGDHVYSSAFGSSGDETPIGVGVDGAGNIVIAGSFDQGIDFGAGLVRAVGATDMFVARLSR